MSSGREEGEIDSEEDGLRKRINELEEENAEYEKIKRISECYEDKYGNMYRLNEYSNWEAVQRAGQVPTDASSISSVEFPSPKKKKHKRHKKTKCKRLQQRSHRCAHQRHKHCKSQMHGEKRHHHRRERLLNPYYQDHGIETISLDTSDNSEYEKDNYSIATMEIESADENDDGNTTLPLSREELRLALGRGAAERKNNICSLKERLQPDNRCIELSNEAEMQEESMPNSNDADNVVVELHSDNSISIEEHELRLIALRSAIMRKHATRKKRNAEIAYSPTDFDDLLVEPISPVASDIEELEGDMEISPASSPTLIFSPIQYDEEQNSNISLETLDNHVDHKPIDMDIASSDSEPEECVANVVDLVDIYAQQTHDIPLPAGAPMDGLGMPMSSYDYASNAKSMPYDNMYMPSMHFGTPNDMAPAMLTIPTTTTLPPFAVAEIVQNTATVNEVENCIKNEIANTQLNMNAESPKSAGMDIIAEDTQDQSEACSDEEEAEALRALLLSQRQAAKTTRTNSLLRTMKRASPPAPDTPPQIATAHAIEMENIIIKPQPKQVPTLTQLICSDSPSNKPTPTESILKQAVLRLKVKSFAHIDESDAQDVQQTEVQVPRLKIRAFARCNEFDEHADAHAHPPSQDEHDYSAFVMHPTHINGINYELMQQVENGGSFESILPHSTPEIYGTQLNANNNNAALLLATAKRRLEKEAPTGRTLRTIELKQGADNCSSQHSTEDSNSGVLDKNKTQQIYETQAKKLKTTTTTETTQPSKAIANSLHCKERAQETNSNAKELATNASGEKENKEISSASASVKDSGSATAKAKPNTKLAVKTAKVIAEKRKVSVTTAATKAAIAARTTALAKAKPPVSKAVPNKTSVAPKAAPKLLKTQTQQLKIVKPNKVINKSVEKSEEVVVQRKVVDATNHSRILTPTTLPNIKVKQLIIRLGQSDSSSEDEEILRNHTLERCIGLTTARTATPDSLNGVLNENVYLGKDTAVTLSNSACASPADAHTQPNEELSNASTAKEAVVVSETFERKLENFLKNMRSKTLQKSESPTQPRLRIISVGNAQTGTPTAVRSLPFASQEEYKRLVHRMKILEKQKHLKKNAKSLLEDAEKYTKTKQGKAYLVTKAKKAQSLADTAKITSNSSLQSCNDASSHVASETDATTSERVAVQSNVCEVKHSKKVTPPTTKSAEKLDVPALNTETPAKNERVMTSKLLSCETILASISNNILTRLDKSLQLVDEAKVAKIAKIRHEQRLKELRLEIEQTQRKVKDEQMKITRIHPQICATNELITKLKQKRAKVFDMAVKLGRSIKGDDYRLNNDLKSEITLKTKGLATHIKHVNSIRYCDLDVLDKKAPAPSANNSLQEIYKTNDAAITTDSQQKTHVNDTQNAIIVGGACDNHEKTIDADISNCGNADNHLSTSQPMSENCDDANVKVKPVQPALACAEELPALCDSGKEVQRPVVEDNQQEEDNVTAVEETKEGRQSVRDYVSPLEHLRSESGKWDPNDIVCPYELMGQCEDKDCSYRHFSDK